MYDRIKGGLRADLSIRASKSDSLIIRRSRCYEVMTKSHTCYHYRSRLIVVLGLLRTEHRSIQSSLGKFKNVDACLSKNQKFGFCFSVCNIIET